MALLLHRHRRSLPASPLQLGDKIRALGAPGFPHVGIVIELPILDSPIVAHNRKGRGVEFVPIEAFSEGRDVQILSRVVGGPGVRAVMVARARSFEGHPYDFLFFNCEHYASFVQTGQASSPQVQGAFLALLAIVVGVAVMREA